MSSESQNSLIKERLIAVQWPVKCHVISATLTYAAEEELLEVIFFVRPTAVAMSHFNKDAAGKGVF
jgi:hypothetical protein